MSLSAGSIPKVIHQTYINKKKLSNRAKKCIASLRGLNKDFKYIFWSDKEMYHFVKKYFPEYEKKFLALPRKIMQVDIFRPMLLYIHGGVYCDVDYRFFKPFGSWLDGCDLFLPQRKDGVNFELTNALMASSPRHIFWKLVVDDFFQQIGDIDKKVIKDIDVINKTGPAFITTMFKKYQSKMQNMGVVVKRPTRGFFCPPPYRRIPKYSVSCHECHGTWRED